MTDLDGQTLLYLPAADVRAACEEVDPIACVREAMLLQGAGQVVLPAEAYLGWDAPGGGRARSISLPSWLGGDLNVAGTKIINANPGNVGAGLPRASGVVLLFDPHTARPVCILEGAYISGLRTAAVSVLAAQRLCCRTGVVGVLGAGFIAEQHVRLLASRIGGGHHVRLFDIVPERAGSLAERLHAELEALGTTAVRVSSPAEAVSGADLVLTCTTTVESYIPFEWLAPGAVAVNVSLDDLEEDVLLRADRLYVDDWQLIVNDDHRLLGRLARAGRIAGPGEEPGAAVRAVTGTLADLLAGRRPGRESDAEVIVVNPFGMSIHDIAIASQVHRVAVRRELGLRLPR